MKDLNAQLSEQQASRACLEARLTRERMQAVDAVGLKQRLQLALSQLETVPADKQRPIYESVLKFAEFYPNRMRLGLWAPAPSGARTSAEPAQRAGSCSVLCGAPSPARTGTPCGTGS